MSTIPTNTPYLADNGIRTLRNTCNEAYMLNPIYSDHQAVRYNPSAETLLQGQNQILVKYPPYPVKVPEHVQFQVPEYKNDNFCPEVIRPVGVSTKETSIDRISSEIYPCAVKFGSFLDARGEPTRIVSKAMYAKSVNEYY